MGKKRSKTPRFVPRLVLGAAVSCVVPACVSGCGPMLGVAADAFGVADSAFDAGFAPEVGDSGRTDVTVADAAFGDSGSGDATDAPIVPDGFSVADTGFGPG